MPIERKQLINFQTTVGRLSSFVREASLPPLPHATKSATPFENRVRLLEATHFTFSYSLHFRKIDAERRHLYINTEGQKGPTKHTHLRPPFYSPSTYYVQHTITRGEVGLFRPSMYWLLAAAFLT